MQQQSIKLGCFRVNGRRRGMGKARGSSMVAGPGMQWSKRGHMQSKQIWPTVTCPILLTATNDSMGQTKVSTLYNDTATSDSMGQTKVSMTQPPTTAWVKQ